MQKPGLIVFLLAIVALFALGATPQATTKHFERGALSFDYPSNWTVSDSAKPQALDVSIQPAGSDLQIDVYLRDEVFNTPESAEEAKTKLVEPHIAGAIKQFKAGGLSPTRTEGSSTLGGQPAHLTNVKADLAGEQGGNEVHWIFLNDRLIILTTLGSDADVKRLSKQLEALRNSIAIKPAAPPAPAASPTPKP